MLDRFEVVGITKGMYIELKKIYIESIKYDDSKKLDKKLKKYGITE